MCNNIHKCKRKYIECIKTRLTKLATNGAAIPPNLANMEPVPIADDRRGVGKSSAVIMYVTLKTMVTIKVPTIADPTINQVSSKI